MSVEVMADVWNYSKAQAGTLLVMLAIADNANRSTGIAWPSITDLSRRSRLSTRQVQRAIRQLQAWGELEIHEGGGGPGSTHTFRVTICRPSDDKGDVGVTGGVTSEALRVTSATDKGDVGVIRTVRNRNIRTVNEPLRVSGTQKDGVTWWKNRYERAKRDPQP